MILALRSGLAAAAILLTACSATGQNPAPKPAESASGGPVATVAGQPITDADLDVRGELMQLEQQAYDIRMQALEEVIADRLIAAEAQKRGVSKDKLIESEISSKVEDPTPLEVEGFYEQQKARIRQPLEDVRPQVVELIRSLRERDVRQEFVAGLRESADVKILIDPPRMSTDLSNAPFRGPENAPITIVEFSDFQCPFCRRVQPTLKQLQEKYGDKLRWSFKDLPLISIHPDAQKAAEAARCAGDQEKFWEFRAAMFDSNQINRSVFDSTAEAIGLDKEKFTTCLDSDKHAEAVQSDLREAESLGLNGTPAFLINGVLLSGAQPYEQFEQVIERELDKAEQ
jgi:protein-disulfide isomerase